MHQKVKQKKKKKKKKKKKNASNWPSKACDLFRRR